MKPLAYPFCHKAGATRSNIARMACNVWRMRATIVASSLYPALSRCKTRIRNPVNSRHAGAVLAAGFGSATGAQGGLLRPAYAAAQDEIAEKIVEIHSYIKAAYYRRNAKCAILVLRRKRDSLVLVDVR